MDEGNMILSEGYQLNAFLCSPLSISFFYQQYTHTRERHFHAVPQSQIPPLCSSPSQSAMAPMTMSHHPSPMSTQMSLPHNLSIITSRSRRNILPHHSPKIANPELTAAITDQRTVRTASNIVGGASNNLRVFAGGAWSYGLPDHAAKVAEAVEGGAVAEESAVGGARSAVGVGCWSRAGYGRR